MTAKRYVDEIRPVVIPFLDQHDDVTIFKQDNARPHSASISTAYVEQEDVDVLGCPSYSPDLSQIKHLWDYPKYILIDAITERILVVN